MRRTVADLLKLPARPAAPPEYNVWRELRNRGYPTNAVGHAVETEPGIQAIVYRLSRAPWASRPPQSGPRAILYIAHHSSDMELREEPLFRELMEKNANISLFTCDVRGIGDSWPTTVRGAGFSERYGTDYFYSAQSLMLDRPYVGQKTYDILRVLDWLKSFGHTDVHLIGKGWGAPRHVRCTLRRNGQPGHAEELAHFLRLHRRDGVLKLAALCHVAERTDLLRSARLLRGADLEKTGADRTLERLGGSR